MSAVNIIASRVTKPDVIDSFDYFLIAKKLCIHVSLYYNS